MEQNHQKKRQSWLGHLLRFPKEAPAQQALNKFLRPVKRPPGRPISTLVGNVIKELKELDINDIDSAREKAGNRDV